MTTLEMSRNRDSLVAGGPTLPVDSTPILGTWANFDTEASGIVRLLATSDDGRLELRVTEVRAADSVEWDTQAATVLADGVDQHVAVGFLAKAELALAFGSRVVTLCAYLNRGLLTIDAHIEVRPTDLGVNSMSRAHFYLADTGAQK